MFWTWSKIGLGWIHILKTNYDKISTLWKLNFIIMIQLTNKYVTSTNLYLRINASYFHTLTLYGLLPSKVYYSWLLPNSIKNLTIIIVLHNSFIFKFEEWEFASFLIDYFTFLIKICQYCSSNFFWHISWEPWRFWSEPDLCSYRLGIMLCNTIFKLTQITVM